MTGSSIAYTLDDRKFDEGVAKLGGVMRTSMLRGIGVALVEETNKRFDSARDPFGQKWAPLNPGYAVIKKGPGILRASQQLQRSITFAVAGNKVTVGTNRIYGAIHQFGGTITAKTPKGLSFVMGFTGPRGKRGGKGKTLYTLVTVQSVFIPARPYLGFGPNDRRAVLETVDGFVTRAFSS